MFRRCSEKWVPHTVQSVPSLRSLGNELATTGTHSSAPLLPFPALLRDGGIKKGLLKIKKKDLFPKRKKEKKKSLFSLSFSHSFIRHEHPDPHTRRSVPPCPSLLETKKERKKERA